MHFLRLHVCYWTSKARSTRFRLLRMCAVISRELLCTVPRGMSFFFLVSPVRRKRSVLPDSRLLSTTSNEDCFGEIAQSTRTPSESNWSNCASRRRRLIVFIDKAPSVCHARSTPCASRSPKHTCTTGAGSPAHHVTRLLGLHPTRPNARRCSSCLASTPPVQYRNAPTISRTLLLVRVTAAMAAANDFMQAYKRRRL